MYKQQLNIDDRYTGIGATVALLGESAEAERLQASISQYAPNASFVRELRKEQNPICFIILLKKATVTNEEIDKYLKKGVFVFDTNHRYSRYEVVQTGDQVEGFHRSGRVWTVSNNITASEIDALAYLVGQLCRLVEAKPLVRIDQLLNDNNDMPDKIGTASYFPPVLPKSIYTLALDDRGYDFIDPFRDLVSRQFKNICRAAESTKLSSRDNVLFCNTYYRKMTARYQSGCYYLGYEKDSYALYTSFLCPPQNDLFGDVNIPIIGIAGFSNECQKEYVQLELYRQFREKGFRIACITYNPIGVAFDFYTYQFQNMISVEETIHNINYTIRQIDKLALYDAILLNIASGICPLSRSITNGFGLLSYLWMQAVPIDYLILNTNIGIAERIINRELARVAHMNTARVSLYISQHAITPTSLSSKQGIEYYQSSTKHLCEYGNRLTRAIPTETPLFKPDDLLNGTICDSILRALGGE